VSVAVVTGFKHEIRRKVMGFDSQITIQAWQKTGPGQYEDIAFSPDSIVTEAISLTIPDDAVLTYGLRQPGILKTDEHFLGVMLNGIESSSDRPLIEESIVSGTIPDFTDASHNNSVILSTSTCRVLNLDVNDKVLAYMFIDNRLRVRNLTVAAIYDTSFGEYDRSYAFCSMSMLQRIMNIDSTAVGSIHIDGLPLGNVPDIAQDLQTELATTTYNAGSTLWYQVDDIYHTGALYFNWLDLLDTNVVVILILMALVSGFSLVSSLFIIILERVTTIGLLKSMGATDSMIRRIFILMGQRLVVLGMVIGNAIALTLLIAQYNYSFLPLDPDAYYLNHVPVMLNWWSILAVNIGVFTLAWAMLLIPACIISRISPASTMRYE
ncbi:MAG: FtsX-like permease family protein, partial [Muribaculaceae bacterium]|nr:FtsX-like permease family protein [Muribaculaceae bacterium]